MDAFWLKTRYPFLKVRHEETGIFAAVMQKLNLVALSGLRLGSGGPGATHLINGVYDTAMDNTPHSLLSLDRPVNGVNLDAFKLNQN